MLSEKGLATKILFWVMLCLIVALVLLFLMGKVGILVGDFDLFGQQKLVYVHLPEESDITMTLESAESIIIRNAEESSFTVYSDIAMKNTDSLPREGIDAIISFQGYMKGDDFEGCRVERTIKPGDEMRVFSDECGPLKLNSKWSGPVNIKAILIEKSSGSMITSKDAVIDSFMKLSAFGTDGLALCAALNEYRDYSNSMLYIQNDLGDLAITKQKEGYKTMIKINDKLCENPSLYDYVGDANMYGLRIEPDITPDEIGGYTIRNGDNIHIYKNYDSTVLDASYT